MSEACQIGHPSFEKHFFTSSIKSFWNHGGVGWVVVGIFRVENGRGGGGGYRVCAKDAKRGLRVQYIVVEYLRVFIEQGVCWTGGCVHCTLYRG